MKNSLLANIKKSISRYQLTSLSNLHRLPIIIFANKNELKTLGEKIESWFNQSIFIHENNTLKANDIIGQEYNAIIYHLDQNADPNMFAAISGTLISGGVFILLCEKSFEQHHDHDNIKYSSYFFQHLIASILNSNVFLKLSITNSINNENFTYLEPKLVLTEKKPDITDIFSQQKAAITSILKVLSGHRRRPLILTADRGRGKSAAIGIAIGNIIKEKISENHQENFSIIITAPSAIAAAVIFKHIKIELPKATFTKNKINIQTCNVLFVSPDKLIHELPRADLLIIEEAAGHHLYVLNTLLQHYSRIVFATTLHGYEGSGQGFITRFKKTLNSTTPGWRSFALDQPIRWANHDPLENFINKIFLLNGSPSSKFSETMSKNINNVAGNAIASIETKIFTHHELIKNLKLLESIFCLLKSAHYKTSPNDLRQLMDAENAIIFASFIDNILVAAAITEKEGPIPNDLADNIYKGNRRPRGQLIPQSIIMHLGIIEAAKLKYLRVMRIAVSPDIQGKKIGSHLLEEIIQYGKQHSIDCIGTSFGATVELLNFWFTFNFHVLRLGYKKNSFSGTNAILMILPLTDVAKKITDNARNIFLNNFIAQLPCAHNNIDTPIISIIFNSIYSTPQSKTLSAKTFADVESFVLYHRSYDDNLSSILNFVINVIQNSHHFSSLNNKQSSLIILKVFQNKSWMYIAQELDFSGQKQVINELKSSISLLMNEICIRHNR